ncbi:unnamed protein product [Ectocarpus sp. CCAP 1310/34]|nr:unnamed protein product [Ectocarpus sp. CCAP 1310/34]
MTQETTQPSQTQSQTHEQSQQSQQEEGGCGDEGDGKAKAGAKGGGEGGGKQQKEKLDEVPLIVPPAVCKDNKASLLVHLRDEALNFAGDTGAIGRISVGGKKKGRGLTFDLKGQQFSGQIIPSATVMVVGIGKTEAKVEGLFSEVCRLDYKGNVFDAMGGEVLKGEMDDSYKFEEEDVNARGAAGGDGDGGEGDGGEEGKNPKLNRKKSFGKGRGGSSSGASSGKRGGGAKGSASKKAKK